MKKELGKWLMDIAKYTMTAVILTSIFGEFSQKWVIYAGGALTVACTLGWGLYLLKDKNKDKKAEDSQSLISRLTFTEKDRSNHRLSFLVLQQVLHSLVYLAVLETVKVDLGGFKVGMPETLADYGYVHSRPFQDGCKSMPCDIGREIYL